MSNYCPVTWTVRELQKLGAKIQVYGNTALIFGREEGSALYGSELGAADLRGGASLVLAGLATNGRTTELSGIADIDRGYENFHTKLRHLGDDIKRSIGKAYPLLKLD